MQRQHTLIRGYSRQGMLYCDYQTERIQRAKNVMQALWLAKSSLSAAVRQETGEALDEVLGGILPAILMALAVVAGTTLVGASLGALAGGVFGFGVGAIPGAIAGGELGFSAGLWILEWMGLAFLAVYVGKKLHQVTWLVRLGFDEAWGNGERDSFSRSLFPKRHHVTIPDHSQVVSASKKFAQAVAVLIRLILEGIILYLTARGIAKLPELVAQLKNSRLGEGFAVWVEKNHQRLMKNPKLRQSTDSGGMAEKPVKVLDHPDVPEQSKPTRGKQANQIGDTREQKVADIVGGTVSRQKIKSPSGGTDLDVIGPDGELIMVGGPAKAKNPGGVGRVIKIYQDEAIARGGVQVKAYFSEGTPQNIIDLAIKKLGSENVIIFK